MNENQLQPPIEEASPSLYYDQTAYSSKEEPIYVMTVELEKGKSESIKIYSDSKPDELAYDFCKLHNLDFSSLTYLTTQIKKLFESIPPTSPSVLSNSLRPNQECIVEVDEEDNQTSDQRGVSSLTAHSRSNSNSGNIIYNTDKVDIDSINKINNLNSNSNLSNNDNIEEEKNKDNEYKTSEQSNVKKDTKENITNSNNTQKSGFTLKGQQQSSLFSYQEFYNRFKQSLIEKKKGDVYENMKSEHKRPGNGFYINNSGNRSKSIYSRRSDNSKLNMKYNINSKLTLAKNEEMLIDFFKKCSRLDEIYQNKITDASLFNNLSPKEPEIIINEQPSFNSPSNKNNVLSNQINNRSAQNINNQNSFYNIGSSRIQNQNVLSKSLNSYNNNSRYEYPITRSDYCGVRLYREGIEKKERINNKLSMLKQEILSKDQCEYTYYPATNHISQRELHKRLFNNRTPTNTKILKSSRNKSQESKKNTYRKNYHATTLNSCSSRQSSKPSKQFGSSNKKRMQSIEKINEIEDPLSEKEIVYNKKKEEIFRKIFNLLDNDKDMVINILSMDIKRIPITIYNIIQPIINEIKFKNRDINQNEFIEGCMKLFNVLSFNDKRALLNFGTKI